jgi:hypothetical protein
MLDHLYVVVDRVDIAIPYALTAKGRAVVCRECEPAYADDDGAGLAPLCDCTPTHWCNDCLAALADDARQAVLAEQMAAAGRVAVTPDALPF